MDFKDLEPGMILATNSSSSLFHLLFVKKKFEKNVRFDQLILSRNAKTCILELGEKASALDWNDPGMIFLDSIFADGLYKKRFIKGVFGAELESKRER
jgi:hypothetical protein